MTLISDWGEKLDREHPLPEYPRPQMQRDSYQSLNGSWQYQITERNGDTKEDGWKNITVPFALGSLLSGSEEQLEPGQGSMVPPSVCLPSKCLPHLAEF